MPRLARVWFGQTLRSRFDDYLEYIMKTGVPDLRATPGNQGLLVLQRHAEETAEFGIISFWNEAQDIRRFAGQDIERAVYYPDDQEFLIRKEPYLKHYEIPFFSIEPNSPKMGT